MCVLAEVRKNVTETIRVRRTEYSGAELLDVRVWYESPTGEMKPTKKGLTLRPETWRELLQKSTRPCLQETKATPAVPARAPVTTRVQYVSRAHARAREAN